MMMMESASTSELLLAMTTACNMRHPSLTKLTKLQGLIQAVSNKLCFVGGGSRGYQKIQVWPRPQLVQQGSRSQNRHHHEQQHLVFCWVYLLCSSQIPCMYTCTPMLFWELMAASRLLAFSKQPWCLKA